MDSAPHQGPSPNPQTEALQAKLRRRLTALLLVAAVSTLTASTIGIGMLYRAALTGEGKRLYEMAVTQAHLVDAVARFDEHHVRDVPGGAWASTLSQLRDALEQVESRSHSTEVTFGRLRGDQIEFLLRSHADQLDEILVVSADSDFGEPMRRALAGAKGIVMAKDYAGARVLAAHVPVESLQAGIVTKVRLSEIRRPYVYAGVTTLCFTLILVLGVAAWFRRAGLPVVRAFGRLNADLADANNSLRAEVAERERAEEACRASEARFRSFIEQLSDAAFTTDTTGNITYVNKGAEAMTGRTVSEIIGCDFLQLVDAEGRAESWGVFRRALDGEKGDLEVALQSGRTVHVRIEPHHDGDGRIIGTVGIAREVTEQHEQNRLALLSAEIADALTRTKELRPMLQWCAEAVQQHLGAAFTRIWTLNNADHVLELQASAGMYTHIDGGHARVPVGQFKIGRIAQNKKAHLNNDVPNDPEVGDREWARREGMIAFAGHPLIVDGEVVGVLALFARRPLSKRVLSSLAAIADGIALGIRRLQAEQSLQHGKQLLRSIIDHIPQVVFWKDRNSVYLGCNKSFADSAGLASPIDVVGKNDFDLPWKTEESEWYRKCDQEVISCGQPLLNVEESQRKSDGSEVVIETSKVPLREPDGNIIGILGIYSDITGRKRKEEWLRLQSEALNSAANAIVITESDGRIIFVNPAFTRTTGYQECEAVGNNPRILKSGTHPPEFYENMWGTLLAGEVWHGEIVNRRKSGELYTEEMTVTPVHMNDGGPSHFIAIKQDITDRKRAEQQRLELTRFQRESEELRQAKAAADTANQAKSEFLAGMSHELRTPLNGVIGMIELLLRSNLDDDQRRHAWLAKSSGDTLLALIKDILDFSKIEAGKLELECTEFDVRHTVESLGASMAAQAAAKGLELVCSVSPSVPSALRGDPGRVQQVLMNLTANAIKFTEKGEVVVRATRDEETDRQVTIRFTVTDTGIGIPSDRKDRLFRLFSQVDASTTRKYGGTGLGLAISKRLLDLMGGQIGVESEPGRGSTFWFTVPLERAPSEEQRPTTLSDDIRSVRVLAVDDNATNRELLREQLLIFGLDHQTASSGESALSELREAAAKGRPFGMAILDLMMPEMDGEQLARAIKTDPNLKNTVLVLLTSVTEHEDSDRWSRAGFSGWLSKPVRSSQLLDAMVDALACARTIPSHSDHGHPADDPGSALRKRTPNFANFRILLVEDNDINKEAAFELLAMAGFQCDAVENGDKAVNAVLNNRYDAVLMDCQMPVMDGFEAARTIRRHERDETIPPTPRGRIPIIALTANAIKGDRDRCIESGMDDYLSKPLDPERLFETLDIYLSPKEKPTMAASDNQPQNNRSAGERPGPRATGDSPADANGGPPFNLQALLKQWGTNKAFANKLIDKFCQQAPRDVDQLERAAADGNADEMTRLAHGLKGAAGYAAADRVRDIAARLEELGRAANLSDAQAGIAQLRAEVQCCVDAVGTEGTLLEPGHAGSDR